MEKKHEEKRYNLTFRHFSWTTLKKIKTTSTSSCQDISSPEPYKPYAPAQLLCPQSLPAHVRRPNRGNFRLRYNYCASGRPIGRTNMSPRVTRVYCDAFNVHSPHLLCVIMFASKTFPNFAWAISIHRKKSCSRKFLQPGRHRYLGDQSSASVSVATATNYPITETHLCADWNSCAMLYSIVEVARGGCFEREGVSTQRDSAHDLPSSIFVNQRCNLAPVINGSVAGDPSRNELGDGNRIC